MPKTTKSEQMDFKGLEIIADEFTGTVNVAPSTITAAVAAKTQIAALVSPSTDYTDLTAVTVAVKAIIDALKA